MSVVDRLAQGYEPNFDIDLALGAQGELFVKGILASIMGGGSDVEVKRDEKVAQTGNVYIEYECLKRGKYVPSGIAITKALLWAFVLPADVLILAPVVNVRQIARDHWPRRVRECTRGSHPTRGVAIPVGRFVMELYQYEVASIADRPT